MASFSFTKDVFNNSAVILETDHLETSDFLTDCVILSLILLSNTCLLVLEVKIWIQRRRLSQPRFLIISLGIIDALCGVFGILPRIILASSIPCNSSSHLRFYMATRFVLGCFIVLSKLTVVLMGIERFISIRAPFFYVRNCSLKTFAFIKSLLIIYSLVLGSVSMFLDLQLFRKMQNETEHLADVSCHKAFLYFEFYVYSWRSSVVWKYLPIANGFTVFVLMQDFVLIILLLICNTSVIGGLQDMEKRIMESCPRPTASRTDAIDLMTATGKEFSRLMVAINIAVLLITTPYMVIFMKFLLFVLMHVETG